MNEDTVQVYRRVDGGFGVKAERAALVGGEMLIGRGLELKDALELIEELSASAAGRQEGSAHG